jgi:hypothetical protein
LRDVTLGGGHQENHLVKRRIFLLHLFLLRVLNVKPAGPVVDRES